MEIFLIYFIPVFLYSLWQYLHDHEISFWEFFAQMGATIFVFAMVIIIAYNSSVTDRGLVVGNVESKKIQEYRCNTSWSSSRSYGCRNYDTREVWVGQTCSTDSNGKETCTQNYETEYRYDYPWERDYFVNGFYSGLQIAPFKETVEISRTDRQGAVVPNRWNIAKISEPFAMEYSYNNYVGASANSLYHKNIGLLENVTYPKVYDYYRILTQQLMSASSDSGVNLIVFDSPPGSKQEYAEQVAKTLRGYKLVDIVIVLNDDWVDVRSWSKTDIVNVEVRDHIIENRETWMETIAPIIKKNYVVSDPEDFVYLMAEYEFPIFTHVVLIFFLMLTPVVIHFLKTNNISK